MRVYKTSLNSNQDLISYVMPDEVEKIYSIRTGETYDIPFEDLYEYIEITGYLTLSYPIPKDGIAYTTYVDIDHKFKPIEAIHISHLVDQVYAGIRQNLIETFFADDSFFTEKSDIDKEDLLGIIGETKILKNETVYLHHKYKCGIWESSNTSIVEIDKYSGKIFGKNLGESTITYTVDTGSGILTCFKTIKVIYEM